MKLISALAKRLLNNATPGLHDAKLGDIVEDLQKRVSDLEAASQTTPGSGTDPSPGSPGGNSTWDNA